MTIKTVTKTAEERCKQYRLRILEISQQVPALHIAPAFSCIEIVDTIYNELMQPHDVFIMSKGHGCMTQYVILEDRKILTKIDLDLYCKLGGRLGAHPDSTTPGIAASTGSLGHGLSITVGQAYAEKIKKTNTKIYCLLSDGECQEGSTWEAMMMAANLKLDNLVVFIDNNDFGGMDRMSEQHPAFYPLTQKAFAFGWNVNECDGHDVEDILYTNRAELRQSEKPSIVVCKTVKGKGVSYMENVPIWHYRSPNLEEYQQAVEELT